ncbi:phosphatase PAP2 family protein [Streptomyces sp. DSM 15324]|uniref:phosphatase PAP2 family protein n=1 Tax=Streptomyces sp. DSM 15324 TaxID=1739111 RepID=UPI00099E6F02|nr:phosphatase PAP2 family protein [Streptomyces sp. DSM 15324]
MATSPHQETEDGSPTAPATAPRRPFGLRGLLLALPALLLALITWQVIADGPLLALDARLSDALRHPDRFSELLSDLGNVQVAVPVLVLVAVYVALHGQWEGRPRWWLPPVAALVVLTLVPLIVVPLKEWTARPGTPAVPPATGYYPSGHTATAAVAYGSAVMILLPWLLTALARRLAVATAALLVLAVSYGLVRHGYHWPLDVLASWCLCTALLGTLGLFLRTAAPHDRTAVPARAADAGGAAGPACAAGSEGHSEGAAGPACAAGSGRAAGPEGAACPEGAADSAGYECAAGPACAADSDRAARSDRVADPARPARSAKPAGAVGPARSGKPGRSVDPDRAKP